MSGLDAMLEREILRLRGRYQLSLDEFRGLYISDEQIDALLTAAGIPPAPAPDWQPPPALARLTDIFALDAAATAVLALALAPETDQKYATLIAYLNDDVRRRWPTIDLACRLFGPAAVPALAPDGPLFGPGLLLPLTNAETRTARPLLEFCPNPVLTAHLFGPAVTPLPGFSRLPAAPATRPAALAPLLTAPGHALAILAGAGADRAGAVRALGRPVIRLVLTNVTDLPLLRDAALATRLDQGVLLLEPEPACLPVLAALLPTLPVPICLLTPPGEAWRPALTGCPGQRLEFAPPDHRTRQEAWTSALASAGLHPAPGALAEVAERFRLSPRQIAAAAASLALGGEPCGVAQIIAAAREQTAADLSALAQRIAPHHGWQDLVLAPPCLRQLQKFAAAIRQRSRVFSDWGLAGGPGLTALFGGGPGTGKTMSAGVLARESGLDLWRIDLSAVVSKYIGETEKHLDRIFAQAHDGNAILFFDEADAIFGKRSEVKDAHDRYANIEVAYLLQRLESYEGVVILASNLARNIDMAFSRRLHFVIEFSLPDAPLREKLWRAALPPRAPLAPDLDLTFIARQFQFAGGDIRVAALDAAFAAAADDTAINMVVLLQAISRQLLKQGKVPQSSDFGPYRALVAAAEAQHLAEAAQ